MRSIRSRPGQRSSILHKLQVGLCLLAFQVFACQAGQAEQARMADEFINSMGVNVAVGTDKYPIVKERLLELGIRHIRTTTGIQNRSAIDAEVINRLRELGAQGIRSTLLWRESQTWAELLTATKQVMPYVVAVEGPNETDLPAERFSYQGQAFPQGTRVFQKDLYQAIKNDSVTRSLPVILTSVSWGMKYQNPYTVNGTRYEGLGDMEAYGGSPSMDYGNMHAYTASGDAPGSAMESWHLRYARKAAPILPLMATEGGYNTADQAGGVSEWAHSRYVSRWFLEHFRYGVVRSFLYRLDDSNTSPTNQEGSYGLIRSDNTLKPAFTALKNLIALLNDPGDTFTPQSLNFTLSGRPATVHHILLQKRTGAFYLVIWNDAKNFSVTQKRDIQVADRSVDITFNAAIARVSTYLPLQGTGVVNQYQNTTSLALQVPDHPLVVEVIPSSAASAAPIQPAAGAQSSAPAQPTTIAPAGNTAQPANAAAGCGAQSGTGTTVGKPSSRSAASGPWGAPVLQGSGPSPCPR